MWRKLVEKIEYPQWARTQQRFVRLDSLDRFLDGTIYDHLEYSFYEEEDSRGKYIPVEQRRPSAQTNLPGKVAKMIARKLFAGRHTPRIVHENEQVQQWLMTLIAQGSLYERMLQASIWGSVGSVAVTFKLVEGALKVDVWRAKYCYPVFNATGDLSMLRVQYTVSGRTMLKNGFEKDIEGRPLDLDQMYWFVRDWEESTERTYMPIKDDQYDPLDGPPNRLIEDTSRTYTHNMGFVPGVWMVNLAGGAAPDGACTWEPAVNLCVDADYTLSQLGRGVRYNAAPQLVIVGDLKGDDDPGRIQRGPVSVLHFDADTRLDDGTKMGGGDAKLLEMVGNGVTAGMKYVEYVLRLAVEAISASRKNPEEAHGTLSGRAMELMDDAFFDLVHELRSAYGDEGFVPLLRKIVRACCKTGAAPAGCSEEVALQFGLRWPRLYGTTPQDEVNLMESMAMGVQTQLVDIDVAKSYVQAQMDLEDYHRAQPAPETGSAEPLTELTPADGSEPPPEQYTEGSNTDPLRPGPVGRVLPKRHVGPKQKSL